MKERIELAVKDDAVVKEGPEGIFRRTLSWNDQAMTCHFTLTKGATIPLHHHPAVQSGYVIRGKVRFYRGDGGDTFIAEAGASYVFDPEEKHGVDVLEESEIVDFFTPMRAEYK